MASTRPVKFATSLVQPLNEVNKIHIGRYNHRVKTSSKDTSLREYRKLGKEAHALINKLNLDGDTFLEKCPKIKPKDREIIEANLETVKANVTVIVDYIEKAEEAQKVRIDHRIQAINNVAHGFFAPLRIVSWIYRACVYPRRIKVHADDFPAIAKTESPFMEKEKFASNLNQFPTHIQELYGKIEHSFIKSDKYIQIVNCKLTIDTIVNNIVKNSKNEPQFQYYFLLAEKQQAPQLLVVIHNNDQIEKWICKDIDSDYLHRDGTGQVVPMLMQQYQAENLDDKSQTIRFISPDLFESRYNKLKFNRE